MNRANEFTAQSRFAQPPEVTAQGKIIEAMPALELEDNWKTNEQKQLEKRIKEKEDHVKKLESERALMTLEKIHDEAETKRAQKDIESALDMKELKEEDGESDKTIEYEQEQAATSSTAPPVKKPKKTRPCDSKTGKQPVKRKASTTSGATKSKQRKITDLLTPDLAAVAKNQYPKIVLTDCTKKQ